MGVHGVLPEVKRSECDVDHSPSSSTKLRMSISARLISIRGMDSDRLEVFPVCGSRYGDSLLAGRSGGGIPVGAKFSAFFQTGPGAQSAPIQ
jgi:hypothetical protein